MRLDQSSVDLSTLMKKIESGELDLQPDFQRGQVWSDAKKRRLIDTVLRAWYIPAIHIVVNDDLDKEEVLDGQQRIRAIVEFMTDQLSIDGHLEPEDPAIIALHGLKFSELPDPVRSRFRRFPITTVRLRDYRPEEPGELFFRLNQLTALTAAEQRNALVGEPRNQIRSLAGDLEEAVGPHNIGFSNARMNYDDVLSRLAIVLENGRLGEKITAGKLERRYRSGMRFPGDVHERIKDAIYALAQVINYQSARLNKASLFSWLYFISDYGWSSGDVILSRFFSAFEAARSSYTVNLSDEKMEVYLNPSNGDRTSAECARIFNDRSSFRVNDVSSVLLRDLVLNVALLVFDRKSISGLRTVRMRESFLASTIERINLFSEDVAARTLEEANLARLWEQRREAITA